MKRNAMSLSRGIRISLLLSCLGLLALTTAHAQEKTQQRDGQHDFDWQVGAWKIHMKRLVKPLTGSSTWTELDGLVVVRKLWDGRANLAEISAEGPSGHLEFQSLRLYDSETRQWSLNFASSNSGALGVPMIGSFVNGRGTFYDQELIDGKPVLVRFVFASGADSSRDEQAFSTDGGQTWETNWINTATRIAENSGTAPANAPAAAAPTNEGQRDFDFAIGTWRTHIARLLKPLSGENTWAEYDGTHIVHPVWNGKANIGELKVQGPAGRIEAMSLRLYNPQSHQWNVSYGHPGGGSLSRPIIGEFKNGRGEFYGEDTANGKTVLAREVYTRIDEKTRRLEIAYSADGGKNWETNWKMTDTLVP